MEKLKSYHLLKVHTFDHRAEMGKAAAEACIEEINRQLEEKKTINMIFAAAPSQDEFLAELAAAGQDGRVDFTRINAYHMDEYIGLSADAPQCFGNFLKERLFDKVPFRSVNYINSTCKNAEEECERYAALLQKNLCDIVCMGIGENGHIAFNDPHAADFNDPETVKVVSLDQKCRTQQVHDGCFESLADVPTHAMTLTIPILLHPESVFCIVPAASKAEAVKNALEGEISESCPASILRTHHHASLWLDADSAALLRK